MVLDLSNVTVREKEEVICMGESTRQEIDEARFATAIDLDDNTNHVDLTSSPDNKVESNHVDLTSPDNVETPPALLGTSKGRRRVVIAPHPSPLDGTPIRQAGNKQERVRPRPVSEGKGRWVCPSSSDEERMAVLLQRHYRYEAMVNAKREAREERLAAGVTGCPTARSIARPLLAACAAVPTPAAVPKPVAVPKAGFASTPPIAPTPTAAPKSAAEKAARKAAKKERQKAAAAAKKAASAAETAAFLEVLASFQD